MKHEPAYQAVLQGLIPQEERDSDFNDFFKADWGYKHVLCRKIQMCQIFFELDYDFDTMLLITKLPEEEFVRRLTNGINIAQQFLS